MGSRVLLSQDLRASKFSMIILETIHSGPEARHTSPPAQVAAATAAAAPAPSSARRPRGPRWEAPVAGSREPRWANSSGGDGRRPRVHGVPGTPPPRPPAPAEAATVCPGPPPSLHPSESSWTRARHAPRPGLSLSFETRCWLATQKRQK